MIDPTRNKISTIFKSKNKDILGFKSKLEDIKKILER